MPNHYNYQLVDGEGYVYSFTTELGLSYKIAFTEDDTFSTLTGEPFDYVYSLSIYKETLGKSPSDNLIKATVYEIIRDFFADQRKCVLYMCDNGDEKSACRHRKFSIWHSSSPYKDQIKKRDNVIKGEHDPVYSSILYHIDSPDAARLVEVFNQIDKLFKKNIAAA